MKSLKSEEERESIEQGIFCSFLWIKNYDKGLAETIRQSNIKDFINYIKSINTISVTKIKDIKK